MLYVNTRSYVMYPTLMLNLIHLCLTLTGDLVSLRFQFSGVFRRPNMYEVRLWFVCPAFIGNMCPPSLFEA